MVRGVVQQRRGSASLTSPARSSVVSFASRSVVLAAAEAQKISAKDVKALRDATGAGMMDAKKALQECNGSIDEAKDWLKKKGMASADKKQGRVAAEGGIFSYVHLGSKLGVLCEVNCETDFVARGEKFQEVANDIAMQIAASPSVEVVSLEDVSEEMLDRERKIEMEKEDLQGKPDEIKAKIVDGRIGKIAKTLALLEQPFIKDTNMSVSDYIKSATAEIGEKIAVARFTKFELGATIVKEEKKSFAEEIAEVTGKA